MWMTHASDLRTPIEQRLWSDIRTVLSDVVQEGPVRDEWHNEHHLSGHADGNDPSAIRVQHWCHYTSLFQQLGILGGGRTLAQDFYGDNHFDIFIGWSPCTLECEQNITMEFGWTGKLEKVL